MFRTYDINDWYSYVKRKNLRKLFKVVEIAFPVLLRKTLGVKKEFIPASLALLLENAYWSKNVLEMRAIRSFMLENLARKKNDLIFWTHPYKHHGENWNLDNTDQSCLHHNIVVLKSLINTRETNLELLHNIIKSILHLHYNKDYSCYTYYPNTLDEIINIQTDLLSALNSFRVTYKNTAYIEYENELISRVLNIPDESMFLYGTLDHYQRYKDEKIEDSHHGAMILHALNSLVDVPSELKIKVRRLAVIFSRKFIRNERLLKYSNRNLEAQLNGYVEVFKVSKLLGLNEEKWLRIIQDRFQYSGGFAPQIVFGFKIRLFTIRYGEDYLTNALLLNEFT